VERAAPHQRHGPDPLTGFGEEEPFVDFLLGIRILANDPTATVQVSREIQTNFPDGATDTTRRAGSENAKQFRMKRAEWS
jgi:hypothetical protein